MLAEMIAIIGVSLCMLTAFIYFLKLIQAWMLHRTLRDAIKRNSPLAAGLVDKIDSKEEVVQRLGGDDRNGLVLIAIGLALMGFSSGGQRARMAAIRDRCLALPTARRIRVARTAFLASQGARAGPCRRIVKATPISAGAPPRGTGPRSNPRRTP